MASCSKPVHFKMLEKTFTFKCVRDRGHRGRCMPVPPVDKPRRRARGIAL